MKCDQCGDQVLDEWRRICCGCGKWLHDACWIDRLTEGRDPCECGGGWNLFDWDIQVTECEAPEVEGVYPPGCHCDHSG